MVSIGVLCDKRNLIGDKTTFKINIEINPFLFLCINDAKDALRSILKTVFWGTCLLGLLVED